MDAKGVMWNTDAGVELTVWRRRGQASRSVGELGQAKPGYNNTRWLADKNMKH